VPDKKHSIIYRLSIQGLPSVILGKPFAECFFKLRRVPLALGKPPVFGSDSS